MFDKSFIRRAPAWYQDGAIIKPRTVGTDLEYDGNVDITGQYQGNLYNRYNSIDLAKSIYDRCTDPRLIMVCDGLPGDELVTNGQDWTGATGATPPTGWIVGNAGLFSIEADGGPSGAGDDNIRLAINATPIPNTLISHSFTVIIGEEYTLGYWFKHGTAGKGLIYLGSSVGSASIYNSGNLTDATWTYHQHTFTATITTVYISLAISSITPGHYEEFDNITCTLTCNDYSGKGHNGTFAGAMTSGDRIYKGNCFVYDLDGTNDYIDFGDDDDFSFDDSGATPFTVTALIEIETGGFNQCIVSKYDSGNSLREWMLNRDENLRVKFDIYDESENVFPYVRTSVLPLGIHLIKATYDGSGGADADDGLNIYVDGVLDNDSKSGTVAAYVAMEPSTTPLIIGCRLDNGVLVQPFMSDIGNVSIDAAEQSAADAWSEWLEVKAKYGL